MSLIVFSHGNSFPASTYRVMLDSLRARGFGAAAIEKYGHDPRYPVTDNWPHLVQQLADFAACIVHGAKGVIGVMLDSPVLGGWRAGALRVVKRTALMARFSPSQVSRRRRDQWDDREAVFQHFRGKRQFARWDEQVLHDYVDHGTLDADGTWRLAFDREVDPAPQPGPPAAPPPAALPAGLRRRAAIGRDPPGRRHRGHGALRQGARDDDRRHAPVPDGKTPGHRRGHRGQPAGDGRVAWLTSGAAAEFVHLA